MNRNKIILDLCGGTGAWSRPYAQHGYDVRVITLPDHDVLTYEPPANVYGILAAPPCTVFSRANQRIPNHEKNFTVGMIIVESCMKIIWKIQSHGIPLKFWVLENPDGYLQKFLGHWAYKFQGWQYGETGAYATKRTLLWGYFNSPKPIIKNRPDSIPKTHSLLCKRSSLLSKPSWYSGPKLSRADRRAITPAGFAKRFYETNK